MPALEMDFSWTSIEPPSWLLKSPRSLLGSAQPLRNPPQQVTGPCCSQQGTTVAAKVDDLVQMFDLQAVVERVTKPVRPVKQRQRTKQEQVNSHNRMRKKRRGALVSRRFQPAERKRQPPEEQMHRDQKRRQNAARAEQRPEERFHSQSGFFPRHLSSQQKPRNHAADGQPSGIVGSHDHRFWDALSAHTDGHRPACESEPRNT